MNKKERDKKKAIYRSRINTIRDNPRKKQHTSRKKRRGNK